MRLKCWVVSVATGFLTWALGFPAIDGVHAENLVLNPGFEAGADSWSRSGDVATFERSELPAPARAVRSGENSVRLYGSGRNRCGDPIFDPKFVLQTEVSNPPSTEAVTISFWYLREGDPLSNLAISLGEVPLPMLLRRAPVGWNMYHLVIDGANLNTMCQVK